MAIKCFFFPSKFTALLNCPHRSPRVQSPCCGGQTPCWSLRPPLGRALGQSAGGEPLHVTCLCFEVYMTCMCHLKNKSHKDGNKELHLLSSGSWIRRHRMRGCGALGGGAGCPAGRWQGLRAGHDSGDGERRQSPETAGVGRQRAWVVADELSRRNGRKETPRGLSGVSAWQ